MTWLSEINIIVHEIDHTIENLNKWSKDVHVDTPLLIGPAKSRIVYEPLGVVLVMGSWNFPLYTTLGPLIHVIGAGNVAIIKPSEISAFTSNMIRKFVVRWLDTNCYTVVEG